MPGRRRPDRGLHWRIWDAEAIATALLVAAIVLAAALTLGRGSPVAAVLPARGLASWRSASSLRRRSR